eukprot:TRINITY_DN8582_c0_g1_i1.p1 TRINITY_DN8582_c0_g1~~TRINITY_DN8582_c0_g1_i1.p1  ORF type:complete len:184 (+),score=73.56 TRINITY_DN8582_c0_g1_i1:85-636(+)
MLACCTPDVNAIRERKESDVYVNVYDITSLNYVIGPVGLGAHHSGVEVYDTEYCFGRALDDSGVYYMTPRSCAEHAFRESVYVGTTSLSRREVNGVIRQLRERCTGRSYHLVRYNCNDFAEELCKILLGDRWAVAFPAWVNRACRSAQWMLPSAMVEKIDQFDYQQFLKRHHGDDDYDDAKAQ